MPAPAIPPATPRQMASLSQAQAAVDGNALMSPALVLALLQAQQPAALRAARAALPTSPDGLNPGDPWSNGDVISFVPVPASS